MNKLLKLAALSAFSGMLLVNQSCSKQEAIENELEAQNPEAINRQNSNTLPSVYVDFSKTADLKSYSSAFELGTGINLMNGEAKDNIINFNAIEEGVNIVRQTPILNYEAIVSAGTSKSEMALNFHKNITSEGTLNFSEANLNACANWYNSGYDSLKTDELYVNIMLTYIDNSIHFEKNAPNYFDFSSSNEIQERFSHPLYFRSGYGDAYISRVYNGAFLSLTIRITNVEYRGARKSEVIGNISGGFKDILSGSVSWDTYRKSSKYLKNSTVSISEKLIGNISYDYSKYGFGEELLNNLKSLKSDFLTSSENCRYVPIFSNYTYYNALYNDYTFKNVIPYIEKRSRWRETKEYFESKQHGPLSPNMRYTVESIIKKCNTSISKCEKLQWVNYPGEYLTEKEALKKDLLTPNTFMGNTHGYWFDYNYYPEELVRIFGANVQTPKYIYKDKINNNMTCLYSIKHKYLPIYLYSTDYSTFIKNLTFYNINSVDIAGYWMNNNN